MGKKKSKSSGYQSKGERRNVSKSIRKAMNRDYRASDLAVSVNKINAWKAGKHVMVTTVNNGADKAKMPFKRVPATEAWGDPRRRFTMKLAAE